MAETMKAIEVDAYGGPAQLILKDVPIPTLGPSQVLVRVTFASVNGMDAKSRAGLLTMWTTLPFRAGGDFAGVIEHAGDGMDLPVGTAVFGCAKGCYAQFVAAEIATIATKPSDVSFEEAAALPVAGVTAWQALMEEGSLKAGQRVLIQGGSGGVGHLAVQIARHAKAFVVATASAQHLDAVKALGADEVFDYHTPLENRFAPVDLVIDGSGNPVAQLKSYALLKPGGLLVSLVGPPPPPPEGIRVIAMIAKPSREGLARLAHLVDRKEIRPLIARIFPLTEAAAAQEYGHAGAKPGKVLIAVA